MKDVVLNGFIGEKYGRHWNIKANNIGDIFACINANYPSFSKDMIAFAEAGGDISIQLGDNFVEQEEELLFSISPDEVIITPLPAGAKGGAAKLLMSALIIGSLFIPGSSALLISGGGGFGALGGGMQLASAASVLSVKGLAALNVAGLALVGVATGLALSALGDVMAPDPSVDTLEANDEYLFDGPENTIAQNNAVPVLLGEMIVGGVLISTSTSPVGQRYDSRGGTYAEWANQGGELTPPQNTDPRHPKFGRSVR